MGEYNLRDGCLLRDTEEHIPQTEIEDVIDIPEQATDWLRLKRYVRNIISNLANGEGGSPGKITDFIYYLVHPCPDYWDRDVSNLRFDGPYTTVLKKYLGDTVDARDIYECLQEVEEILEEPPKCLEKITNQYNISTYEHQQSDPSILQKIKTQSGELDGVSVYLHGSMALRDYTRFSDIDDFVVVSTESWSTFERFTQNMSILHSIAKSFYRHDPLQHHGHWIFTDFDLNCFNPGQMSPDVLEYSLRMAGETNIEISTISNEKVYCEPLWSIVQTIRHTLARIEGGGINMYYLKKLVSSISLMPALLAQIHGERLDKQTAIKNSHRILPENTIIGLRWATKIRRNWDQLPRFNWLTLFKIFNKLAPVNRVVAEEISKRYAPYLSSGNIPYLTNSIVESIWTLSDLGADTTREVV